MLQEYGRVVTIWSRPWEEQGTGEMAQSRRSMLLPVGSGARTVRQAPRVWRPIRSMKSSVVSGRRVDWLSFARPTV